MSQFDKYTSTEVVEGYRLYLGIRKDGFLKDHGFLDADATPKKGRLPKYKDEPIEALAFLVNEKAARAEEPDTSLGERIRIARDYMSLTDVDLAAKLGVSRELVRLWGENLNKPTHLAMVAEALEVPLMWLEAGGEAGLLASSHIGVRVGRESFALREQLYAMTSEHLSQVPEAADLPYIQAYLERAVFNHWDMAKVARQAGGRWQVEAQTLVFAPWVPICEHGLARRDWSDEVEEIIQKELAEKHSIYAAWQAIKVRCQALGLSDKDFPRKISLYKRIELRNARIARYGVSINRQVKESVAMYAH